MVKYLPEILKEINEKPELLTTVYKDNYAVKAVLQYAFDKNLKMELPEGTPPYKPDTAPLGMSPTTLYNQVKKFYIFQRKDLSNARREQLFIQLLESVHPSEAEIVVLIKDQNLTSKYPNITVDLVVKAGLVKEENIFRGQETVQQKETSEGRSLVLNFSDETETKESFGAPPDQPAESTTEVQQESTKKRGRPKKTKE